jgi:hypothetical protein
VIEYRVGSAEDPELWRQTTQVPTNDPWLFVQGLFVPPLATVVVEARVRNRAGAWSDWAVTDGIVVDPDFWPVINSQSVLATGGLFSEHPDVRLGATIGEVAIGDAIHPELGFRAGFWATVLAFTQLVSPDSFLVFRGTLVSGGLDDLLSSDDASVNVRAGLVLFPSEPPAQVIVTATSSVEDPRGLSLIVESRTNTPGLARRIELFNFVTQQFETLDVSPATTSDATVEVAASGDVARFVEPGTRSLRAKVAFVRTGLTLLYPWTVSLDQVVFKVTK